MKVHAVRFLLAACVVALLAREARAGWVLIEIPVPPLWTGHVQPADINSAGVVCGLGNYVSGVSATAFTFDGQTVTELAYLAPDAWYPFASATAINDAGIITGQSHNIDNVDRAVIWSQGSVMQIPTPSDATPNGDMRADGINNVGVVVGYYVSTTGFATAYYYDGATHSLGLALGAAGLTGERSYAKDVNDLGVVCGHAEDALSEYNFFTYDIPTGVVSVLGKIVPTESYFTAAMNNAGQIVGRGRTAPGSQIFALRHGDTFQMVDPTIIEPQWSADIASDGRVIGNANTSSARWAWFSDAPGSGSMRAVGPSGWSRVSLAGVNDRHWMTGFGRTAASPGADRGFLLKPPQGDADHDGDVDVDDLSAFSACLTGPTGGGTRPEQSETCIATFDFPPTDGDVDLEDFAALQAEVEGATDPRGANEAE